MAAPIYGPKTKMNNYYEDATRAELASRDYEARRARGDLVSLRRARAVEFVSRATTLSHSEDGYLRYGDILQIVTLQGGRPHTLANNISTSPAVAARVTGAPGHADPVARTTWVVQLPTMSPAAARAAGATAGTITPADDVLRYGSKVVFAADPSICVDPTSGEPGLQYVLYSQQLNNIIGSGRKGRQETTMATKRDPNSVWVIVHPSSDKLTTDGEPVHITDAFQLVHLATNTPLAAVPAEVVTTDMGVELDVHARRYAPAAHSSMSVSGDVPTFPAMEVNLWSFVTGAEPAAPAAPASARSGHTVAFEDSSRPASTWSSASRGFRGPSAGGPGQSHTIPVSRLLAASASLAPSDLVARAHRQIAERAGMHGFRSLALAFAALDQRGNGVLPRGMALAALFKHGVTLEPEAFDLFFDGFDEAQSGLVSSRDILEAVSGDSFSGARREAVDDAFSRLTAAATAKTGRPAVTVALMVAAYNASNDPRVASEVGGVGLLTALEARNEFGRQWPRHTKPTAVVSRADFQDYYAAVSASIEDDWAFIEIVHDVWAGL